MIHRELQGKLIGKLSFAQTSIFCRFGRTPLKSLYAKIRSNPYVEALTDTDVRIVEWRSASIFATIPRIVEMKAPRPEILTDTDAAKGKLGTSSAALAAVVIESSLLFADGYFSAVLVEKPEPIWRTIFSTTAYIYGLELLAVLATVFRLRDFLRGGGRNFAKWATPTLRALWPKAFRTHLL